MFFKTLLRTFFSDRDDVRTLLRRLESYFSLRSESEIELLATALLADTTRFATTRGNGAMPTGAADLADGVRRFLAQFDSIEMVGGTLHYSLAEVASSRVLEGGVTLGTATDGAEIVALPHREEVFVVDGTEEAERVLEDRHKTIWHFVIWQAVTSNPPLLDELELRRVWTPSP